MRMSKFVNDPEKPFHTSGYAQAANGSSMGAVSTESFTRRKRIDQHRRAIGKYRQSHIGHASMREPMRLRRDDAHSIRSSDTPQTSRQQYNTEGLPSAADTPARSSAIAPTFQEPPKRNFDPFS